ncbi:hypothetical protein O3M35_006614 [Rhynocoris fuscipes]|uniref:Androgen-dependent TFPI-regulating protein n=1 Tax=Rhynocoris fuscipes TaxID=488301 RepID=A0AAW1DJY7_9HEMI
MIQFGSTKLHYGIYLKRLFHLTVVLLYAVLILSMMIIPYKYPNIFEAHRIIKHGYKYRNFLFSIWATGLQFTYFCLAFSIDCLEIHGGQKAMKICDKLHSFASYLLFAFVFPVSAHVFIVFWSIYAWDREYIYPLKLDTVAPFFLNHIFHTFPPILSVMYMLTCNKKVPSLKSTLTGLISLLTLYGFIFMYVKLVHNEWVYLLFEVFSDTGVKILLAYCALGSLPFLFLGHKINEVLTDLKQNGFFDYVFNISVNTSELHEKMS